MNYKTEFPNFVLGVDIPEGFTDASWHNDVCPRFDKQLPDGNYLVLWIDYLDAKDREHRGFPRFTIDIHDSGYTYLETLISSDAWEEILGALI